MYKALVHCTCKLVHTLYTHLLIELFKLTVSIYLIQTSTPMQTRIRTALVSFHQTSCAFITGGTITLENSNFVQTRRTIRTRITRALVHFDMTHWTCETYRAIALPFRLTNLQTHATILAIHISANWDLNFAVDPSVTVRTYTPITINISMALTLMQTRLTQACINQIKTVNSFVTPCATTGILVYQIITCGIFVTRWTRALVNIKFTVITVKSTFAMTNVTVQQIFTYCLIWTRPVNLTFINLLITISALISGVTFTTEIQGGFAKMSRKWSKVAENG